MTQKERSIYMNDLEYKKLQQKAQDHFQGKGFLSQYLRKIANSKAIIILEGKGSFKIIPE